MAWVKIDDQFTDHPKAADAGPLGIAMQVAGLCYANRHLTDGFISHKVAARLLDFTGIAVALPSRADPDDNHVSAMRVLWLNVCDSLVSAGLWEVVDGGWQIHDFLEYNPSRADTLTKRAADMERKRTPKGTAQPSDNIPNGIRADSTRPVPVPVPVPVPLPDPVPDPPGVVRAAPKRANAQAALPSAEELLEQLRPWADKKGVRDILADEVDRFRDYCLSGKNGRPVTYADYAAGCRKWITNPSYGHTSQSRAPTALNGQRSNAAVKEERMFSNVHAWTPPERSAR